MSWARNGLALAPLPREDTLLQHLRSADDSLAGPTSERLDGACPAIHLIEMSEDGTTVSAWIRGVKYAETQTLTYQGDSVYALTACSLFGDLDCNCLVDVADIMKVAGCWHCECWEPCYDPRYDIDGDCDIDIVDIMLVVARRGESCG